MKFCLPFMLAFVASSAFAQQELPKRFFVECHNGEYLVLVDRQKSIFSHKKPYFKERETVETDDVISALKMLTPVQFNKWTGYFKDGYNQFKDCKILDPDSRQPLFK